MDLPLWISLLVLGLLLYASSWISSAETALFSLSSHTLKTYRSSKEITKQLISKLLAHPRDLLVTVFIINTCVNILLQNVASDMFGSHAGWSLKVGVPLALTLVFGEIIPKYIGLQNNVVLAEAVAGKVYILQTLLSGIRRLIIAITAPISHMLFFFLKKERNITKDELIHVIETSQAQGILDKTEAELVAGYLNLQDAEVKEIMWPKEDILFYDIQQPLSRLTHLFSEENRTRIPVCDGSLEHILGIATAMQYFRQPAKNTSSLISLLQKPFFIPETTAAKQLLVRMNTQDQALALVVDEYGTITGLISREDLMEIVVGQIQDNREQQALYLRAGPHEVIASGKWELTECNSHFHSSLESQYNSVTLGGWLTEKIGEIPKSGSKWEFEGFLFHILAASPTRITRLFVRKL